MIEAFAIAKRNTESDYRLLIAGGKRSNKYYNEISVGIDFTARDLQEKLKKEGLPWEKAKAFDGSSPIGKFIKKDN